MTNYDRPAAIRGNCPRDRLSLPCSAMRLMVVMLVLAFVGCGVVDAPEPDPEPADQTEEPARPVVVGAPEIRACSSMDCDLLIGDSCPVCGKPELTCACYKLKGDGSDELGIPCAPPVGSLTCR